MANLLADIERLFSGNAFQRPLFYASPNALRFELSTGGDGIEQFFTALTKASEICLDIFNDTETLTVCLRFWSDGNIFAHRYQLAQLSNAHISIPQNRSIQIEAISNNDLVSDDMPEYWITIAFEIPKTKLNNLLWCALCVDFPNIQPNPACMVYLFNRHKPIMVFPYDDRGMDVVSAQQPLLDKLSIKYQSYLLERRMSKNID